MVQALEPVARQAARSDTAAQPRGRGVAARRHAAVARRDQRGHRGARLERPTSTSPRTRTSSTRSCRSTAQGEPVDPVTVAEELRRADLLDNLGGRQALLRLQAETPASANAAHYAKHRRRARAAAPAHRRRRRDRGDGLRRLRRGEPRRSTAPSRSCSRSPSGRVSDSMIARVRRAPGDARPARAALRHRRPHHRRPHRLHRPRRAAARAPAVHPRGARRPPAAAARPASRSAPRPTSRIEARRPVLFFSMEMGTLELTKRLLAAEARVEPASSRPAQITDAEWNRLHARASAASPRRRSSSTTTRTARSWRCGPRRAARRPATATSGSSSSTTSS